jgi:hypothetical protein
MQWDSSPNGGFTSGTPWLPLVDPEVRNVADTDTRRVRELIAMRDRMGDELEVLEAEDGLLLLGRGEYLVAINTGDEERPLPGGDRLPGHLGTVVKR